MMKKLLEWFVSQPYWKVALVVSGLFAAGIFLGATIFGGVAIASKAAVFLGFLSLCGFAAMAFLIPDKTDAATNKSDSSEQPK